MNNCFSLALFCRKMKLDLDREKGLELFGKLIRTKNIESLQGNQSKTGPEPLHPADSKQKLQVTTIINDIVFKTFCKDLTSFGHSNINLIEHILNCEKF